MKNFVQPGNTVTLIAPSGGVKSGDPLLVGSLFGVCATDALEGAEVEVSSRACSICRARARSMRVQAFIGTAARRRSRRRRRRIRWSAFASSRSAAAARFAAFGSAFRRWHRLHDFLRARIMADKKIGHHVLVAEDLIVGAPTKPKRLRKRKPSLAEVLKQAARAGFEVARYEVDPDGKISVVTGKPGDVPKPESDTANEWDNLQ